jgi:PAS domain S-box-containing protein
MSSVRKDPERLPDSRAILQAIAEGTSDALYAKDAHGRYLLINEAGARDLGRPPEEIVGRSDADLMPPDAAAQLAEHDRSVMAAGEPRSYEERVNLDGSERIFLSTKGPYRDGQGKIVGVFGISRDITERKRIEAERERERLRATFLAEAGALLESSLDYQTTLKNVARLAIPDIADWCAVDITDPDGALVQVALAHADPEKLALAEEMRRDYPPDPDSSHGAARVIRMGESLLYPEIPEELLEELTEDERHLELVRELRLLSAMVVPLAGRGETLGAITFVSSTPGRRFGRDDLLLAEEVGRRAGIAVQNARLYSERSYIAQTLQRSLLPPVLPSIPGVEVAARFHAAGEGFEVGGDFYDLFATRSEGWAAVIGDVCGKGPDAAAITALARYTLRAAAMQVTEPSRILALLNEAMLQDAAHPNRFCTVAYAALQPAGAGVDVKLASGGHPLPFVLRADGRVERLGTSGTLIGIVPDVELEDTEARLGPGDTLVLYTDGVVDARTNGDPLGEEGLAELLATWRSLDAVTIAERIERAAVEHWGGTVGDDVAVVVLRARRDDG